MVQLNLPTYAVDLKKIDGKIHIFDAIRKKYLVLTPEEWVRQHFLQYLISHKGFVASLMSLEAGLKYNQRQKRTDLVVYDQTMKPLLLVECKAPSVKITDKTFQQIITYYKEVNAQYMAVTNGLEHYFFQIQHGQIHFLEDIPDYPSLKA